MTAIVLAGQRDGEDALAKHAGATCKAVVEIDGKPMLLHVLEALTSSDGVDTVLVSGPGKEKLAGQTEVNELFKSGAVTWLPPQESPSSSAYDAMQQLKPDEQVLLTTADHPLLSVDIVNEFCARSVQQNADIVIGFAPYSLVREAFPEMKKTVLRFKDGEFCGCNLFAFLTPKGREAANFWRRLESHRKNPFRIIRFLGWRTVAKYLLGKLSLEDALNTFSQKLGLRIGTVIMPFADAAVDVDSISDYHHVQQRFKHRAGDVTAL